MDPIVSVLMLLALAAPIGLVSAWFVNGGATGIARAFLPAPPMEWPHGVQEDDDFRWQWSGPDAQAETAPAVDDAAAWVEDLPSGAGTTVRPVRPD